MPKPSQFLLPHNKVTRPIFKRPEDGKAIPIPTIAATAQYSIADNLGISHIIVVSLQNIGGGFGNMICVHNVIAACATVGLLGVEGLLIKRNLIPMSLAAILTGIIGLILVFVLVPSLF